MHFMKYMTWEMVSMYLETVWVSKSIGSPVYNGSLGQNGSLLDCHFLPTKQVP